MTFVRVYSPPLSVALILPSEFRVLETISQPHAVLVTSLAKPHTECTTTVATTTICARLSLLQ